MDEKTSELREIFMETTDSNTVTETQSESPGSLIDAPDDVAERLAELIEQMQEQYQFDSTLERDELCRLVRGFHDDETDEELAETLGCEPSEVRTARLDCHLIRESDRDAAFEFEELRRLLAEEVSVEERAERLGVSVETAASYSEVAAADRRSTRANNRFRDEFAELLTDAELTDQLAANAREDGLQEATEDIETDVSF